MPAPPCKPDCQCGKHSRTALHNMLIGRGVSRTAKEKANAATAKA